MSRPTVKPSSVISEWLNSPPPMTSVTVVPSLWTWVNGSGLAGAAIIAAQHIAATIVKSILFIIIF